SRAAAETRPAQSAMGELDAFKRDAGGICTEVRSRILDRKGFLEIPPLDRDARVVEEIDRAVLAVDGSLGHLLMPVPQALDLGETVLEYEGRIFGRSGEAVHVVVEAALAIVEIFGLYLHTCAFGEAAGQDTFDFH